MLSQSGFTGAGMSDQADKFSILDRQIHILQRILLKDCVLTINMIQILNFNCYNFSFPLPIFCVSFLLY